MIEIKPYSPDDEIQVVQLWTECGLVTQWNNPHRDIERKLKLQPELFLVGSLSGKIIATVMAGYEGHRGWINYLVVHPNHRRSGIGKHMMDAAEIRLQAAGCPKINLQVRTSNTVVLEFYKAIGYQTDDVVSLGKRLKSDK